MNTESNNLDVQLDVQAALAKKLAAFGYGGE